MIYNLFKLIHIAAVVIFLGNIITGLFWMHMAKRSKNVSLISHAMKGIIRSDRLFTLPGIVLIIAGGIAAAVKGGFPILGTGWILWSIILFSISGIAFVWKVAPLQKSIYNYADKSGIPGFNKDDLSKMIFHWELWGLAALITPVIAFVMMVLKNPSIKNYGKQF